jgi:hypothetical protein
MSAKITMARSSGSESPPDSVRRHLLLEPPPAGELNRWVIKPELEHRE